MPERSQKYYVFRWFAAESAGGAPRAGGEVGDLPPAAWLYVLQACAQINPARSASDVRDRYDVVRAAGDAHWAGVVTEAARRWAACRGFYIPLP